MNRCQNLRGMELHPARTLYQRFHDDTGAFACMISQERIERGEFGICPGQGDNMLLRQQPREQRMHAFFGVADRHRADRVTMIGTLEGDELAAPRLAPVNEILQRHLHGDFDGYRARIGKEHPVQVSRQQGR